MAVNLETTYPGRVDAADAEYPFGKPRNRTTPGDGTPFDEALYRDYVGWASAAMKQAGITAVSNVPDKVGASEILQGIARHIAGGSVYMIDSGIADAYVLTPVQITAPDKFEGPNILFDGMRAEFIALAANATTTPTAAVNGTPAKTIVKEDGSALTPGDIDNKIMNIIRYDAGADKYILIRGAATQGATREVIHVQDQKISGTGGGTPVTGSYQTRILNTVIENTIAGASLSSNQIILPAGSYKVYGFAVAYRTDQYKTRLYNVTDALETIPGSSEYETQTQNVTVKSFVSGSFTIGAAKTFELQYRVQFASGNGLGNPTNFGTEVYSDLKIEKVG